jgi:hypothetical protein
MIWESQGNRTDTEIIISQLQALQDAGLFSNKSLLLIVICAMVFQLVLEKDLEDKLDRSSQKLNSITRT